MEKKHFSYYFKIFFFTIFLFLIAYITYASIENIFFTERTFNKHSNSSLKIDNASPTATTSILNASSTLKVFHLETPETVRGVYVSSWVIGTPSVRDKFYKNFDGTNLNAVLIDVKDSSGVVTFDIKDPKLKSEAIIENRIRDIEGVIDYFHKKNIYVIGRIAVFQDPGAAKKYPERAIKSKKNGNLWKDNKGLTWTDAGNKDQWKYTEDVAIYAYSIGFDEVNFDYIRFPSDGILRDMYLPDSEGQDKVKVVSSFFSYIGKVMKEKNIPTSADIFGQTTSDDTGMGIGQTLQAALRSFDYVSPMSYPSHYIINYNGIKNPDASPYETIHLSYRDAITRIDKMAKDDASTYTKVGTTTNISIDDAKYKSQKELYIKKLRPFLQDFTLHFTYGKKEIQDQIRGITEHGINSYLMWNPSSRYTKEAYTN
ncbi:MAG: hypothetical protein QG630_377 [Patescibacteria group bacterium]|nr:hypothetical protein [Patescibacteria group bacterium]